MNKQPDFLILDESTSAMDFETEVQVVNVLNDLVKEGRFGVMMVTHRIGLALMSEKIYLLEDGNIKMSGSHEELLRGENMYSTGFFHLTGKNNAGLVQI
jgi:ABC-type multidrug transport system fused ATPase/permease subunit